MELRIIGTDFQELDIIDSYESLIWTERYRECGDFELYTSPAHPYIPYLMPGNYLVSRESDRVMIIEDLSIKSDPENGAKITVTGRSLESILDRRVVWDSTHVKGNVQEGIKRALEYNIGRLASNARRISNFVFQDSDDPAVTELTCELTNLRGEELYEVAVTICKEKGLGFKITMDEDNQFVFQFYSGIDRSYSQNERPCIIYSPNYDNLVSSNYAEKTSTHKNAAMILGKESVGASGPDMPVNITTIAEIGDATGLDRREIFVDATNVSNKYKDPTTNQDVMYGYEEYQKLIEPKGYEELAKNVKSVVFDGECDTNSAHVYGKDFGMGDIVQIEDEYGHQARSRVVELIRSTDASGYFTYPTFESIEEGE